MLSDVFSTVRVGPPSMTELSSLERDEIAAAFSALGIAPFRGSQVFHWIYGRGVTDFTAMTNLSRDLRARLAEEFSIDTPVLESRQTSTDGTTKFLLRLQDDH